MKLLYSVPSLALALLPLAGLAQSPAAGLSPAADGKRAYLSAGCHQCHGTVAQGGVGPRLAPKPMPIEALTAFVRASNRSMPPYGPQVLTDDELQRIHRYLTSIEASPPPEQIPQLR